MENSKQWWIQQLRGILAGSHYEAIDNPTVKEDCVIVVERGTQRPHYIAIKPSKRSDLFSGWAKKHIVDSVQSTDKPNPDKIKSGFYHYNSTDKKEFFFQLARVLAGKEPPSFPPDEYWPSLEEYDPKLTKNDWLTLLANNELFDENSLFFMAAFYNIGGEAACSELSKNYGQAPEFYNIVASQLAHRVLDFTNCPVPPNRDKNSCYWPILFVGKKANKDDNGSYIWKLRSELKEALQEFGIEKFLPKGVTGMFDKNMILYGPPGTGKTYSVPIYAVAICDNKRIEDLTDHDAVMRRYNELKAEGRIAFTTFHQSYGYEEFIEGIKPVTDGDNSSLQYKIESGVFKRFCNNDSDEPSSTDAFESSWQKLVEEAYERGREYQFTRATGSTFKAVLIDDSFKVIWTTGSSNTLAKSTIKNQWEEKITREASHNGNRWAFDARQAIIDEMRNKYGLPETKPVFKIKNKVFIIDEINRGNISKIFGELITLIEDTKREGAKEAMSAILPYSGEKFSVPDNVYILGTMNTADRSIALMDTALRRRFSFVELMPDEKTLRGVTVAGIDVETVLKTINERITILYDREHTIGHALFMKLKDKPTLDNLKAVFKKSVIPLLQEYFYEDWQKIQLVLGDNAKTDNRYKFIKDEKISVKNVFKGNPDETVDIERNYSINEEAFSETESYRQIYE